MTTGYLHLNRKNCLGDPYGAQNYIHCFFYKQAVPTERTFNGSERLCTGFYKPAPAGAVCL